LKGNKMAIEKKITKKAVSKAAVKKVAAVKPAVVKPAAPKAGAKKAPVKKVVSKKQTISQERFYAMVSEAAYFASQNDGNRKGSVEYWMEAEAAVRVKFNVA
jgi:hypothetical protein